MFILVNPRQLIPTPSMRQWTVSGNGLSTTRRQSIAWTNIDLLSTKADLFVNWALKNKHQ